MRGEEAARTFYDHDRFQREGAAPARVQKTLFGQGVDRRPPLPLRGWPPDGALLDRHVAAVELLNVLRPTVAVARYITFIALALHTYSGWRTRLREGGDEDIERFVQEVRRFYPFFPFVSARVRTDFTWRSYPFPRGRRVLLDLYGTNRDPKSWEQPAAFQPERFRRWDGSAFNLIPQGGGDHYLHHRCPGEWITIALMKQAVRFLTSALQYEVPDQDLWIRLSRMPAVPKSRFVIRDVRRVR